MKFRVLHSTHSGPGGATKKANLQKARRHAPGSIIESDQQLDKLFPNKFEVVDDPKKKKQPEPEAVDESGSDEAAVKDEDSTPEKPVEPPAEAETDAASLGKDVTKMFPKALKNDLLVFQTPKERFNVTKEDEPTVALNGTPLKAKDVARFIQSQIEEA